MQNVQHYSTTQDTKSSVGILHGDQNAVDADFHQTRSVTPGYRFHLPPQEQTNPRRRAASLKRCRLFRERESVSVKQATTREELEAAYRLVHDAYVEAGYIDPHSSGMRLRIYEALPHAITMIAQENGQVIGTISLILDSPLGLPMQESYSKELDDLRLQGRRLAEVSGLAVAKGCRNLNVFIRLIKHLTNYALRAGVDDLCVGISPEHAPFFAEVFLFEPLGDVRSYSSTKEDYVVAMRLELNTLEARIKAAYSAADDDADLHRFVFTYQQDRLGFPQNPMHLSVMTPELLRYFFIEKSDVLRNADTFTLFFLQSCYPYYNFHKMLSGNHAVSAGARRTPASHAVPTSAERPVFATPLLRNLPYNRPWTIASAA